MVFGYSYLVSGFSSAIKKDCLLTTSQLAIIDLEGCIHVSEILHYFTVVCLVTWPWIRSEAGGDLVLIQTPLLFISKCKLVSIRTARSTYEKQ